MKRITVLLLAFIILFSFGVMARADAIEITFNTDYQSGSDSYVITGTAPADSNVLLLVYSPLYDESTLDGLYYFETKNSITGAYTFTVPMKADAPIGTYIFKVSVNGIDAGMAEQEYRRGVIGDNEVKKFIFDGSMTAGGTISAVATIGNSEAQAVLSPTVVIALYKKSGCLERVAVADAVMIASGGRVDRTATISDLPEDIENYEVKAFMLADFTSIKPITKHIFAN